MKKAEEYDQIISALFLFLLCWFSIMKCLQSLYHNCLMW